MPQWKLAKIGTRGLLGNMPGKFSGIEVCENKVQGSWMHTVCTATKVGCLDNDQRIIQDGDFFFHVPRS